jgi:hypothetical protein|tara:strand:- start:28 stop:468 length:441 start_codon:yes stop_codon:yes gene_type:complete
MELTPYELLTKFQKRWVDNMIVVYPELETGGAITLEKCTEGIVKLKEKHAEDPSFPKIGTPNWNYKINKIDKGIYFFPAPGADSEMAIREAEDIKISRLPKPKFVIKDEEDADFVQELKDFGIDIDVADEDNGVSVPDLRDSSVID